MPKSWQRCSTNMSHSSNEPSSRRSSMRSRAVSLPLACCAAMRFSPPPSARERALLVELPDDVMHGACSPVRGAAEQQLRGGGGGRERAAADTARARAATPRARAASARKRSRKPLSMRCHIHASAWRRRLAASSPDCRQARRGSARPAPERGDAFAACSALAPSTGGRQCAGGRVAAASARLPSAPSRGPPRAGRGRACCRR